MIHRVGQGCPCQPVTVPVRRVCGCVVWANWHRTEGRQPADYAEELARWLTTLDHTRHTACLACVRAGPQPTQGDP